jgi:anti-repressor protein
MRRPETSEAAGAATPTASDINTPAKDMTMNNIVPLYQNVINETAVQTVNGRELHDFLAVGRDYSNWIKARIDKYGFVEGVDFVVEKVFAKSGENSAGGRPALDYHLTLDMAKELSMVENNEQGRAARRYFIECERRAKESPAVTLDLESPQQLRGLLLTYTERTAIAEAKVEELEPKAAALDRLDGAEGAVVPRMAAKALNMPERKFTKWLEVNRWAFRQGGSGPLQGYSSKLRQEYLDHRLHQYQCSKTGEDRTRIQLLITSKGMARLATIFSLPREAAA